MFTFITTKLKDEVVEMAVPSSAQTRFIGIVISTTINNIPTLAFSIIIHLSMSMHIYMMRKKILLIQYVSDMLTACMYMLHLNWNPLFGN